MNVNAKRLGREKRKKRVRKKISGTSEMPRLTVFRSLKHISAQIIDDVVGNTLVSASTVEKDMKDIKGRSTKEGAKKLGELIAERAKAKGITQIVFDRCGYRFHGRVRELANAAREKGLRF